MPGANQYKAADFIAVIPGSGGIISAIAKRLGCDWHTAKKYIELHPTVKAVYDAEKEGLLDLAEVRLIEKVKEGDPWAIKYYLAKMGQSRGWGDRIEIMLDWRKQLEAQGVDWQAIYNAMVEAAAERMAEKEGDSCDHL